MIRSRMIGRRGQGMTEYIVIVGLIAIGLVVAVSNFRDQIDRTIQGTDGNGGAVGGVNNINDGIRTGSVGGTGGTGGGSGMSFTTRSGNTVKDGKYTSGVNAGKPWNPTTDPR
jgi:Flp pilus assembly pilin Flp